MSLSTEQLYLSQQRAELQALYFQQIRPLDFTPTQLYTWCNQHSQKVLIPTDIILNWIHTFEASNINNKEMTIQQASFQSHTPSPTSTSLPTQSTQSSSNIDDSLTFGSSSNTLNKFTDSNSEDDDDIIANLNSIQSTISRQSIVSTNAISRSSHFPPNNQSSIAQPSNFNVDTSTYAQPQSSVATTPSNIDVPISSRISPYNTTTSLPNVSLHNLDSNSLNLSFSHQPHHQLHEIVTLYHIAKKFNQPVSIHKPSVACFFTHFVDVNGIVCYH